MMDIKIYQVNLSRDKENVAFMDYERTHRILGKEQLNCDVYDKVFEGQISAKTLEDIYRIFNVQHPKDFKGHSLSVSDSFATEPAPRIPYRNADDHRRNGTLYAGSRDIDDRHRQPNRRVSDEIQEALADTSGQLSAWSRRNDLRTRPSGTR